MQSIPEIGLLSFTCCRLIFERVFTRWNFDSNQISNNLHPQTSMSDSLLMTKLTTQPTSSSAPLIDRKNNVLKTVLALTIFVCATLLVAYSINYDGSTGNLVESEKHKWGLRGRILANSSKLDQFNAYFKSKATVIKSKAQLQKDYKPTTWPEFENQLPDVKITAVFLTSGKVQNIKKTLSTFFAKNTYPIQKILVVNDGPTSPALDKLVKSYTNITWIITNIKVGELAAIDQAYNQIETDYYFFAQDYFEYVKPGFIEYCLQALDYDPKLNGLLLTPSQKKDEFVIGPLNVLTVIQSPSSSGFSLRPSVHRLKDYELMPGGYNNATFNISYGQNAGFCEQFLSQQYSLKGYHYAVSSQQFVNGFETKAPAKPIDKKNSSKEFAKAQLQFQKWYKRHKDPRIQKAALKYLADKQTDSKKQNKTKTEDKPAQNKTVQQKDSKVQQKQNKKTLEQSLQQIESLKKRIGEFEANNKKDQQKHNITQKQLKEKNNKMEKSLKDLQAQKKRVEELEANSKKIETKLKETEDSKKNVEEAKKKQQQQLKKIINELQKKNEELLKKSARVEELEKHIEKQKQHNEALESKVSQPAEYNKHIEDLLNTNEEQESKEKQNELFSKMLEKEAGYYRTQRNVLALILIVMTFLVLVYLGFKDYQHKKTRKQEQISGVKVTSVEQI